MPCVTVTVSEVPEEVKPPSRIPFELIALAAGIGIGLLLFARRRR